MLGIVEDAPALGAEIGHAIGDHAQILFEGGFEHRLDMQRRRLADQRHDWRAGVQQGTNVGVVLDAYPGTTRGAEGRDRRLLPSFVARAPEELRIFGIRARPAAFDEMDAEQIKLVCDLELILDREGDPFTLCSIAEGRVVELYRHLHAFLNSRHADVAFSPLCPVSSCRKIDRVECVVALKCRGMCFALGARTVVLGRQHLVQGAKIGLGRRDDDIEVDAIAAEDLWPLCPRVAAVAVRARLSCMRTVTSPTALMPSVIALIANSISSLGRSTTRLIAW